MTPSKFFITSTTRNYSKGSSMNDTTNAIIKNVQLFWAKLDKPVDNFSGDAKQWEIQVRVPKKRRADLEQFGKVKEQDDGTVSYTLRKKAEKVDGSPAMKIRVVDAAKEALDPTTIGNGSTGNVMVMLKDYEIKNKLGKVTKSGTQVVLTAVQVTDLVEYERKAGGNFMDFDEEDTPAPKAKTKAKPASKSDDMDDDIPF